MKQDYLKIVIDFLNIKFLSLPLYKIFLAFLFLGIFLIFRKYFTIKVLKLAKKLVARTKSDIDDKILAAIKEPLKFLFIVGGVYFFFYFLEIKGDVLKHIIRGLLIFDLFWALFNIVSVFEDKVFHIIGKYGKASREMASFIIKTTKVLIVALGIVGILQEWGINVTGFLASLGLGGLAFALAAKDTAANIFGGIAILTDNIFKIGEWVKIGNVEGTVEDIGMRTTKIRAFDKRLIIVPNAVIANSSVENFSRRDKRRVVMRIGLTYNTSVEVVKEVVEEIRNMLINHPEVAKDESLLIYFDEYEDSALSIFCYFFTTTAIWSEYLRIKEDINLKIKEIIEKYPTDFAYPSNSIYFETPLILEEINKKVE